MEERARNTNPTEKEIDKLLRQIQTVNDAIAKYTSNLTAADRLHLLKPRPGGEKVTELVTRVAAARKLQVTGASAAEIEHNRTRALRLAPLKTAAATLTKALDDTIFEAESRAWWATTAYYTALQGVARSDGALKLELEPATSFFALGRRKPKVPEAK
jgi:hypothetical protein